MRKKRRVGISNCARSATRLRDLGFEVGKVEQVVPTLFIKRDFCGFADLLVYRQQDQFVTAIQATTDRHIAVHAEKYLEMKSVRVWLQAGQVFEIWGWGQRKPLGKRKFWKLTRVELRLLGDRIHLVSRS